MKQIPETENPLILRTDFSNQSVWEKICEEIRKPVDGFYAYVEFIDEVEYAGITRDQLLKLIPSNYSHTFIIVVDHFSISHPENPLLILDLHIRPGKEFRAISSQIQGIQNNLSIANMDFEEFADCTDESHIFRGFPEL